MLSTYGMHCGRLNGLAVPTYNGFPFVSAAHFWNVDSAGGLGFSNTFHRPRYRAPSPLPPPRRALSAGAPSLWFKTTRWHLYFLRTILVGSQLCATAPHLRT